MSAQSSNGNYNNPLYCSWKFHKRIMWKWNFDAVHVLCFFLTFFKLSLTFQSSKRWSTFFHFNCRWHTLTYIQIHGSTARRKKNVLELIRSSNCVAWPPVFDLAPKLAATMIVNALFFFLQLQNLVNTELFLLCNVFIKLISFLVKNDERRIVVWSVNVFKFHWPKNMNKCHGHEMGQKKKNS